MKRLLCFVFILLMSCPMLTSCRGDGKTAAQGNSTADSAGTVVGPKTQTEAEARFHASIINGNYTADEDFKNVTEWVRMWLDNSYPGMGIANAVIEELHSASFSELSDSIGIRPMLYSVRFSEDKAIPGAERQPNGECLLKVLAVAVEKDGKAVLSGFLGPGEFDENDALPAVYDLVSEDPRYKGELKPYPKVSLPEGIEQINSRLVSDGRQVYGMHTLPGGVAAALCSDENDDSGQYIMGISLYDTGRGKIIKYIDTGRRLVSDHYVDRGKLVVRTQAVESEDAQMLIFDSKGNMETKKLAEDKERMLYSPDGSKYAYMDKCSLYVAETGSSQGKLLKKGICSDSVDNKSYYPFAWIDDSEFIYGIGGYEFSLGCGLIDVTTLKDTFLKQAGEYASPVFYINRKLYTSQGDMGAPFDPYVTDLKDEKHPCRKVFKERRFIENANFEAYVFSPDGTRIALLRKAPSPYGRNTLYICSSEDGSVIKSYEFQTGFGLPQYLDFYENGRIAVYSERYAFCPKYIYFVSL